MKWNSPQRAAAAAAALAIGLVMAPPMQSATAAETDPVTAARDKILGEGWDNPNVVRARSIGNTTWLVSYGGTVILHDSTIEDQFTDTGEDANTNGYVSLEDVIAADPDAILQDHTHFDQQHNATEVATATGTPFVTDIGGCLFTKVTAIKKGQDPAAINCNIIRNAQGEAFFTPDTWAGGLPGYYSGQGIDLGIEDILGPVLDELNLGLLDILGQDVDLTDFFSFTDYGEKGWPETPIEGIDATAVQVKHSPSFVGRPMYDLSGPNLDIEGSIEDIIEDYSSNPEDIPENIYAQYAPFDLEGSNVGWLVEYGEFSLFHHGSTGPTENLEPGAEEIRTALESLGEDDQVDVEIGGVAEMTFLMDGNYFQDNKDYAHAINAKSFFPTHHFNWYPIWLTNPAATYWPGMSQTWTDGQAEHGEEFPELCYLTEDNYATLWEFKASQWVGAQQGSMIPVTGPGCYAG